MKKELIKIIKDKKFIKEIVIIIIVGFIINALCFMMPLYVHAAGEESTNEVIISGATTLPYYIDQTYGASGAYGNGAILTHDINAVYNNLFKDNEAFIINDTYQAFGLTSDDSVLFLVNSVQPWSNYFDIQFSVLVNPTVNVPVSSSFNWSQNSIEISAQRGFITYEISRSGSISRYGFVSPTAQANYNILGIPNFFSGRSDWSDYVQVFNYPVLASNIPGALFSTNNIAVVAYTGYNVGSPSDFVNADLINSQIDFNQPIAPTFTLPTIDTNLSVIENIKNLFQWLVTSIGDFFVWFINGLRSFFTTLLTNLRAFINAVITAINNGFSSVIQNFKTLFSVFFNSIINFIDLLKQSQEDFFTFVKNRLVAINTIINGLGQDLATILSFYDYALYFIDKYGFFYNQERVTRIINNSDFITALTAFRTQASSLTNNFSSVQEPDHLSFTLDFSNAYYNFGVCEFSFDWILPFRNPIRLFIIGVTVLTMLTNFMEDFPAMFSGGGGHSKNTGK